MRVHVQPCGSSVAKDHYVNTIENPVPRTTIDPYLSEAEISWLDGLRLDALPTWGVTPGKRGQNRRQWLDMAPGDLVLLYQNKRFFQTGTVLFTLESSALAEELWSRTEDGETWECMFFLTDLTPTDIDIAEFNEVLGYSPANIVQGYQRFDEARSARILESFDLSQSALAFGQDQTTELIDQLVSIEGDTDADALTKSRREQTILRRYLFGGKRIGTCSICGRGFPTNLLVCAHIKKRRNCSREERTDLRVVMSACKFGCDELYECGYVFVDSTGVIQPNSRLLSSPSVDEYVAALVGRKCSAWSDETEAYFAHHRGHLPG